MKIDDITTKDPQLVVAYQKFCTRVHMGESFSFWFDKGNNEGKYQKYIKQGAAKELNLDHQLMQKFHALAQAGNYDGMTAHFSTAKAEVEGMLNPRMPEFSISPEYKAYLAVKKSGNVTKALKVLGMAGPKAKPMEVLMKEYAVATTPAAKKSALDKMNKLAKAEVVLAALKAAGLT